MRLAGEFIFALGSSNRIGKGTDKFPRATILNAGIIRINKPASTNILIGLKVRMDHKDGYRLSIEIFARYSRRGPVRFAE